MLRFIKKYWPQLFIVFVVTILCWQNYTPNTFLTGWDNLHPEFNIWANLKRSIFSTWQEYQGLGLLAGMAHASDLVRQLIILPSTLFLPTNLIRYLWHFSMLFLGSLGVYSLSFHLTKSKYPAVVGAVFYLLNFATVQYFFLAFDPYSTFWGFFPWLVLELILYLENPKSLKGLFWMNLLATPSYYVQTLFVVYIICVAIILFSRFKFKAKNYIKPLLLIILINSFWLFPNIYFTLTRVSVTQNSMQNLMATDQFIEQNLNRGNLKSFGLLQGQYYDLRNGEYLMSQWHQHFAQLPILVIGYLLTTIAILGIFSKNKYRWIFISILGFTLIGFLNDTPPFSFINLGIRQIPLLNQIFRNSFTKLLVPVALSLSVLLSFSIERLKKYSLLFIPLIFIFSYPSFTGNFFSPKLRIAIPNKYFSLFSYLQDQPTDRRILNLPQYNYWGWSNYRWGANGSGFLWYGIDQPITDRAFDVWDDHLESFYWQLHYALLTRNQAYFKQLLDKYNISYVLFDPAAYFNEASNSGKVVLENEKLLQESDLKLIKTFEDIRLYEHKPSQSISSFVALPNISSNQPFTSLDPAFNLYGSYQSDPSKTYDDIFPNSGLFSNRPDTQHQPLPADIFPLYFQPCDPTIPATLSAKNKEEVVFYNCNSSLDLSGGHIIRVDSSNLSGRPLLVKIFSLQDNRLIIDSRIDPSSNPNFFFIPPLYQFDSGLGVNFSSLSLSNSNSTNRINDVRIAPIDWNSLTFTHNNQPANPPQPSQSTKYQQFNQTFYRATLNSSSQILTLNQSFSPGWAAFYFQNNRVKFLNHHILVNNWANGWNLPSTDYVLPITIYLFFWPQLLEYLGFILLIGTFIFVFKNHYKN